MKELRIGLVGPCTSGKSTIGALMEAAGLEVRQIAQEHSYAPAMWKQIGKPDLLVFLDVSYPVTLERRSWRWKESDYEEQQRRLAHARKHADLYIDTDELSPDAVAEVVLRFIGESGEASTVRR